MWRQTDEKGRIVSKTVDLGESFQVNRELASEEEGALAPVALEKRHRVGESELQILVEQSMKHAQLPFELDYDEEGLGSIWARNMGCFTLIIIWSSLKTTIVFSPGNIDALWVPLSEGSDAFILNFHLKE